MWFQGSLIRCALVTPEGLLVTQTVYFSQFFPRFFVGLHRICLCANVLKVILNIDICSLLVRIDYVAMKHEWKLQFLRWKTCSSVLSLVPGTLEIAFRAFKFVNFLGEHAPDPLRKRGQPALVDTVSYSIQTCWLLQLLLKPLQHQYKQLWELIKWSPKGTSFDLLSNPKGTLWSSVWRICMWVLGLTEWKNYHCLIRHSCHKRNFLKKKW